MMLGLYDAPPSSGGTLLLDASPFVEDASFSTNEHGFEKLSTTIPRRMADAFRFYDQAGLIYVGIFDGSQIVWEGRLEDPAVVAGDRGSGLKIQALGAWRSFMDDRYTALWSSTSVAEWRVLTEIDTAALANPATPGRFTHDTQNRIYIAPQKNATVGNTGVTKRGMVGYFAPDLGTRDIIGASFDFVFVVPAANWRAIFQAHNTGFTGTANPWLITSAGAGTTTGTIHVTFAAAKIVNFTMDFNAADTVFAGETGSAYLRITNLRIVTSTTNRINTTLTANRAAGANVTATVGSTTGMYVGQQLQINSGGAASETVTVLSIGSSTQFNATFINAYVIGNPVQAHRVLGDEIAKDIVAQVSTLNSAQLSSSTTLIQSPGLDLTDEVYEDAIPADVLAHLIELGDNQTTPRQWEVGVFEGRMLHFRPRGGAAQAWYVDVTDLEVARSLEDMSNSVYATYSDASGQTLRTTAGSDSTSIARYGLTRRSGINVNTTSSTQAGVQRDAQLADHKDPLPRATVRFDAVYDAVGGRWPLWMVRSGDSVTIRNLPPTISSSIDRVRTFRISHTNYTPVTKKLEIELEMPLPHLATMLARLAEGIR